MKFAIRIGTWIVRSAVGGSGGDGDGSGRLLVGLVRRWVMVARKRGMGKMTMVVVMVVGIRGGGLGFRRGGRHSRGAGPRLCQVSVK